MRLLTLLLLCVTLIGHAQELPVYKGKVMERNGLSYKPYSNDPLTAKVEQYQKNGQLSELYTVIDGKKEGLSKSFNGNGQLSFEYTYVNGKKEGLTKSWLENGQLGSEGTYVNDKIEGLWTWYENGRSFSGGCWKAGEITDESYCTKGKQP